MTRIASLLARLHLPTTEAFVGRLLVAAFRVRVRRAGPGDAHEARHLAAALAAGNSDPCIDGLCHLDAATMRSLHDATWPGSHAMGKLMSSGGSIDEEAPRA